MDSLDKNLGVTTLQKSRNNSLDEAIAAQTKYNKKKDKSIDKYNNMGAFTKMMGNVDDYAGTHKDIGTAYNIVQKDSSLQAVGFLDNTDIFFKEIRYFNPGSDSDSILETGDSLTSDFEIGTMAKQGGDIKDYKLRRTPTGLALLTRLEANDPTDVVTVAEIKAAQWRTDDAKEVGLIMKVVVKEALTKRLAKEAKLRNQIENFK